VRVRDLKIHGRTNKDRMLDFGAIAILMSAIGLAWWGIHALLKWLGWL